MDLELDLDLNPGLDPQLTPEPNPEPNPAAASRAEPAAAGLAAELASTWKCVRADIGQLPATAPTRASVLPGWRVADLIAHFGRGLDVLAGVRPAPGGRQPLSLLGYLATYRPAAAEIAEITRALAIAAGAEPLAALDAAWERAARKLDELGPDDRIVLARRGPIRLSDLLRSRLLELIVHADDLSRSLIERPPVQVPADAVRTVSHALLRAAREASPGETVRLQVADAGISVGGLGRGSVRTDPLTWIRLAAGRVDWRQALDSGALASRPLREGRAKPDLSAILPLF